MLLGRLWLYSAKVVVDWGAKEYVVGKPPIRIPWEREKYLGETSDSDRYTFGWSSPEDSDSITTYFIDQFSEVMEADCGFQDPIPETRRVDEEFRVVNTPTQEERSMGEASLPLTMGWIKHQILEGALSAIG